MAAINKGMLKASTLLEVVIAMVIILIVFTLAIGIYHNVLSGSPSLKIQQAQAMARKMIFTSINEANWNDEEITDADILLVKTVEPYGESNDLVIITVTASQPGKTLAKSRQIVKRNSNEEAKFTN